MKVKDINFLKIKRKFYVVVFVRDGQELYRVNMFNRTERKIVKTWYGNNDVQELKFALVNGLPLLYIVLL